MTDKEKRGKKFNYRFNKNAALMEKATDQAHKAFKHNAYTVDDYLKKIGVLPVVTDR